MTDYLWEKEECQQQYDDTISYKKTKDKFFYPKNRAKRERDRIKKVRLSVRSKSYLTKLYLIMVLGIESKFKRE